MKIVQIPNGQFVENCYLVTDEASRECVVIDPGEEAGLILRRITEAGVRPVAIWVTHAHLDHVMGVPRLSRETGAPIYLHPADRELYDHVIQQGLAFGIRVESLPPPDREFVPGETVRVGTVGFTVRHAPTGFEVHGTHASLIGVDVMTQAPHGQVVLRRDNHIEEVDVGEREDLYVRSVRQFVAAVRGEGAPAATGEDGVASLAIALAVQAAARSGARSAVPHLTFRSI